MGDTRYICEAPGCEKRASRAEQGDSPLCFEHRYDHEIRPGLARAMGWTEVHRSDSGGWRGWMGCPPEHPGGLRSSLPDPLHSPGFAESLWTWLEEDLKVCVKLSSSTGIAWAEIEAEEWRVDGPDWGWESDFTAGQIPQSARRRRAALVLAAWDAVQAMKVGAPNA